MRQVRVLHLASFAGNIGDQLNHHGFRPWFQSLLKQEINWTNFEIREIYRKNRSFKEFADLIPNFDLVVIGGGNYFELWPENTTSGTSIDLSPEFLLENKVPILFNALGVDDGQGVSDKATKSFPGLIEAISSDSRYLLSVRNDGSASTLQRVIDSDAKITQTPDHGFFGLTPELHKYRKTSMLRVAINLAVDMADRRFTGYGNIADYIEEFSKELVKLHKAIENLEFVFIPHVYGDLEAASLIMNSLPDEIRRNSFRVSKYDATESSGLSSFEDYDSCDLAIVNRFHANVYNLARGIPTIGISNYVQIERTLSPFVSPLVLLQKAYKPGDLSTLADSALKMLNIDEKIRIEHKFVNLEKVSGERSIFELEVRDWLSHALKDAQ